MADEAMLAAVSAAVKGEDPPAPAVVDEPSDPAPLTDDLPTDDSPAAAAPPSLVDDPPEPATDPAAPVVDAQGRVRGPDGKFAPKAADQAAPAAPPKAADQVDPAAPPPPADPVNDPPPANAKAETRERIQTLANMVKEKDTEVAAAREDYELLMEPIRDAGATVEQFRESMNLLKLINSPHQHEQMQALQYLQGASAHLATRLGQVPAGVDPLDGHPDLIDAVRANPQLRQHMEEVAKARRLTTATQQQAQQAQQRSQQTQAQQQAIQEGQAAVRTVEQTLEASDPHFKAKIAALRGNAAFIESIRRMPPAKWAAAFAEEYRKVPAPRAAAPAPAAPTPLRAKQPAGTAARPATSQLDAVRSALGM